MGRFTPSLKTVMQGVGTLAVVGVIYGSPWLLAALGAVTAPVWDLEQPEFDTERVVWVPAYEPETSQDTTEEATELVEPSAAASEAPLADAPTRPPSAGIATATSGPHLTAPQSALVSPIVDPRKRTLAMRVTTKKARTRPSRKTTHTPRELTKKQQRRRDRRKRQRERMAKQPQCHDFIDQIVQVDVDEWWVGQDLVGCYRAHPRQFARMGGMRWVEDDNDKRVGLKIFVSRHSRGDIARAVGFRQGDVLRSLNGVPLRSTAGSGVAMLGLLGNGARVKFLRGGKEHRVKLKVVGDKKLAKAKQRAREQQVAGE